MADHAKIAELLRQRAEIDLKLADEYEEIDRNSEKSEDRTWVSLRDFCTELDLHDSTVRRYIKDGMPHRLVGERLIRINVAAAEAWLEGRGIEYRRRRAS